MSDACQDKASCDSGPAQVGAPPVSDAEGSAPVSTSSTRLVRELSTAALRYHAISDEQNLALLERCVRNAAAHVREVGSGTVDHIILSGTLQTIARSIPFVESILQDEGWHWFDSPQR